MKLYPIIFAEGGSYIDYSEPDYALFTGVDTTLILYHVPSLLSHLLVDNTHNRNNTKYIKNKLPATIEDICAATISVYPVDGCYGAMKVSLAAGSRKHPGAGITIYGLASNYFKKPLTSDRKSSSSVAARETWAKIEKSSDWEKYEGGLDNYAQVGNKRVYMDILGTYPNRSAKPRFKKGTSAVGNFFKNLVSTPDTEPLTQDPIDDCALPNQSGNLKNPSKMADLLGTANAYSYVGYNTAAPLIRNSEKTIRNLKRNTELNPHQLDVSDLLINYGRDLFHNRYKGTGTSR
jgi:hypothetical protein